MKKILKNKIGVVSFPSLLLWALVIAYVFLPDPVPGPIDDTILVLIRLLFAQRTGI